MFGMSSGARRAVCKRGGPRRRGNIDDTQVRGPHRAHVIALTFSVDITESDTAFSPASSILVTAQELPRLIEIKRLSAKLLIRLSSMCALPRSGPQKGGSARLKARGVHYAIAC